MGRFCGRMVACRKKDGLRTRFPFGNRPFRITIDPESDGSEVVSMVMDRVRAEMIRRLGFEDLLHPAKLVE
jgi:hypothetical protein